jgi:peptidoglycan/LPS O-acetylase OafA/YrhL
LFETGAWRRFLASDVTAVMVLGTAVVLAESGFSDFLTVLSLMLLVPISVANDGVVTRLINVRPLLWLGEISYSLYLAHGLVQFVAKKLLAAGGVTRLDDVSQSSSFPLVAAMLITSLLIASFTYGTIERLGRERLRKAFGWKRPYTGHELPVDPNSRNGSATALPQPRPSSRAG